MTARAAVARLQAKGWSITQIAQALHRNHGQIVQIQRGTKPGQTLAPALQTLAKRKHVPSAGEQVRPLTGKHAPPPRRSAGVELPKGTERARAGSGKTARRVYKLQPERASVTDAQTLRLLESLRGKQAALTALTVWQVTTIDQSTGETSVDIIHQVMHLFKQGWDADKIRGLIEQRGLHSMFVWLAGQMPKYILQRALLLRIEWIVVEQVIPGSRGLARAA